MSKYRVAYTRNNGYLVSVNLDNDINYLKHKKFDELVSRNFKHKLYEVRTTDLIGFSKKDALVEARKIVLRWAEQGVINNEGEHNEKC